MEDQTKVMERIQKMLRLGKNNSNEHEATTALEMAQKLADAYNIDIATMGSGEGSKRSDQRVKGGLYAYQRNLFKAIAELNHCVYWSEKGLLKGDTYKHRLLGSSINVLLTTQMAEYLQDAVENVTRQDYCHGIANNYFKKDAHVFREGMVDRIVARLKKQREDRDREEKRKRDEYNAAHPGHATALVILDDVAKREHAANYNYQHGEGAWEAIEQARIDRALKREQAEREYAIWAEANPEEHVARVKEQAEENAKWAAKWEKDAEKARKRREKRGEPIHRVSKAEQDRINKIYSPAYQAGNAAGEKVGLDRQIDGDKIAGELE